MDKYEKYLKYVKNLTLNHLIAIALILVLLASAAFLFWVFHPRSITIKNDKAQELSNLTGLPCEDKSKRPIAVMLSSDPESRPLSGLEQADIVFEMPVTPNGITRLMAVFQCGDQPTEIGSVRSARQDFIPLAQGLDAVYAHWGGEHEALTSLNNHVIDNIDALKYEGTVFYRKNGIPAPHNGFTNLSLLKDKAEDLGYTASTSLAAYPHSDDPGQASLTTTTSSIKTNWPLGMSVEFVYDQESNTYRRWRDDRPETDAATKKQVSVGVVVVIKTTSTFLRDQYISVKTLGEGRAFIYQNGQQITANWKKPTPRDMLMLTDNQGKPIPLTPGKIWVIVDAPLPQP